MIIFIGKLIKNFLIRKNIYRYIDIEIYISNNNYINHLFIHNTHKKLKIHHKINMFLPYHIPAIVFSFCMFAFINILYYNFIYIK